MNDNLTLGTPWKVITRFSLPVIGGNLFQLFYTLADSVIVGKILGASALAAVGATATIVYFELCFIQGLTGGFGILLGQAFGENSQKKMEESVSSTWILSLLFTVFLTVVACALVHPILGWLNTPADIYSRTYSYLFIIFAGTGATVFYNMISNMLRALGDSRTPLYFLILSSLLNIVLDLVFILPLHLDVAGAALATVLAQLLSALLCILVAGRKFELLRLSKKTFQFHKVSILRHLKIGFPMGFQMSVMCIGQLAMQSAVNRLGTSAIAGYTAANKVDQLSVLVDNAVGIALANYVAQNYGARLWDRIKTGVRSCFLMLTALNILMGALMLFGKSLVVPLFVDHPTAEIIAYSNDYLWMVAPFYILLGALMVYRTAIQSMGNTWAPFGACILELFARVFCALFVSMYFGYRAICFSTPFAWIMALLLLLPVYFLREIRKFPAS
ncbi:MATE family efflux transporter [Mediterraneibacter butyricigenes]|uniref:MATE family efflux transporter n=1 Tax=Mediterraneibacter butyricigenes TaxID=2316025 RepID=A0A391P3V8_9FIRM|nr:MATE family efflux transporter [Mediterraneibacter butyricigenes]GCA66796.1 MATE family efflux transporter [Mediterraneibacter butyricigenes]